MPFGHHAAKTLLDALARDFLGRTADDVDDAVDRWHAGEGKGVPLSEYLGWTWDEYKRWTETAELPRR